MGEVLVFHVSPSSVRRAMKWDNYGPKNLDMIRRIIMENLETVFSSYLDNSSHDLMSEKNKKN
jgi:hypothetical protein